MAWISSSSALPRSYAKYKTIMIKPKLRYYDILVTNTF